MRFAWARDARGGSALVIKTVDPGSPAAAAGLRPGDLIAGFPSPRDRAALTIQAGLSSGYYLADGQTAALDVQRGDAVRRVRLQAESAPSPTPIWFVELRLAVYVLGILVVGILVAARPNSLTWSFALFVILGLSPNIEMLEFAGMAASPGLFVAALFAIIPCAIAVGYAALIAFAARFPALEPQPGYQTVERATWLYLALVSLGFAELYVGKLYGWPSLSWATLIYAMYFPPAFVAIGLLVRTLLRSRGDDRIRLAWAVLGPSLGTLFVLGDVWLTAWLPPRDPTPLAFGLLSAIVPFSMMYAILRHRVIDIGFALNRSLAEAVSQSESALPGRGGGPDRRLLVRRTALLLSANLPLHELYGQLAVLLASFVDASGVLITVGDARAARPSIASRTA